MSKLPNSNTTLKEALVLGMSQRQEMSSNLTASPMAPESPSSKVSALDKSAKLKIAVARRHDVLSRRELQDKLVLGAVDVERSAVFEVARLKIYRG